MFRTRRHAPSPGRPAPRTYRLRVLLRAHSGKDRGFLQARGAGRRRGDQNPVQRAPASHRSNGCLHRSGFGREADPSSGSIESLRTRFARRGTGSADLPGCPAEPVLESNDIETVAPARVGDTMGYARVSTHDQHPDAQRDRLRAANLSSTSSAPSRTSNAASSPSGPATASPAARKRGRTPGRQPLDPETVSAAQKLLEAGLSPARTAKQLGIGRATAYRIAKAVWGSRNRGPSVP